MQTDPEKDPAERAVDDDPKALEGDREHRFTDDDEHDDGPAGAPEARTGGMGS